MFPLYLSSHIQGYIRLDNYILDVPPKFTLPAFGRNSTNGPHPPGAHIAVTLMQPVTVAIRSAITQPAPMQLDLHDLQVYVGFGHETITTRHALKLGFYAIEL